MKKLKKTAVFLTACAAALSMLCSCSQKQQNEEIAVPILEKKETAFKTVKAEITDISEKYYKDGSYGYPYYSFAKFKASGQVQSINVESGDVVKKGDLLCTLDSEGLQEQIEEKEIYLDQAKQTLAKLQSDASSDASQVQLAQLELDIQQLEYDHLVDSLEDYKVYAPCDGEFNITAGTYDHDGRLKEELKQYMQVNAGDTFGYAMDKSQQYLCCEVYDQPLSNVNFGTKVLLTQGAFESSGTVTDIIGGDGGEYSAYVYVVTPDDKDALFDFGDVSICFDVYSRLDTVVVPNNAVKTVGERKFVNLLIDGVKIEQDVETGIEDGENVEITSGLVGGEDVIIN